MAQLLGLKPHQCMGCFPKLDEVPDAVVGFTHCEAAIHPRRRRPGCLVQSAAGRVQILVMVDEYPPPPG